MIHKAVYVRTPEGTKIIRGDRFELPGRCVCVKPEYGLKALFGLRHCVKCHKWRGPVKFPKWW